MLSSLSINNYAIIQELEIDFSKGLTTITGETGAGKSILLGALSLILGSRADTSVLFNKETKCIVEGSFDFVVTELMQYLQENDIDTSLPLILRREINSNGKSRAFINDSPVTLQLLKETGTKLVDIHSQHENLDLNNQVFQLKVIDAFAGHTSFVQEYRNMFSEYKKVLIEFADLTELHHKNLEELDYFQFQFNELSEVKLVPGEQEVLENEIEELTHAEEIQKGLSSVWQKLNSDELSILSLLKECENELARLKKFYKPSEEYFERIQSCLIELKDISSETELAAEKAENNPVRLEQLKDRIDKLYSLQQKHRVKTVDELIEIKNQLDEKINEFSSSEDKLEKLQEVLAKMKSQVQKMADQITQTRQEILPVFEVKIKELLVQLGIPNAKFEVNLKMLPEPSEFGQNQCSFLFTANKKSDLQEISKIASGGELSRLMLSIKYIISDSLGLPSIIFDEIDTGVSGEIAFKVAGIMKEMSENRQVFAITHLPQVASRGTHHYLVYKSEEDHQTLTGIRKLNKAERLAEIARMLSGEQTTEAAMANARELLGTE
jgi:DNA repair protein RecN (Recombination protein N)